MAKSRAVSPWPLVALCAVVGAVPLVRAQQPPVDTTHRDSTPAVLIGRVTDTAGDPVAGAEITVLKHDSIRAISGDSGEFRLIRLPPGTIVFNVRRLGFEPATFTAVLKPGRTHRAIFSLTSSAVALPAVSVADTAPQTHWLDQFERRRSSARGTFFTRADIERKGARNGTDILRTVPGVRLAPIRGGTGNQVIMNRGAGARTCIPAMFVHNVPYSGTLDDFMADDIEALEVYVGVSEIPPELDKNGRGICGAIVVWTRDPNKKPGDNP
jgi:hypothetical protein